MSLRDVRQPSDLRALDEAQLAALAQEIRDFLVESAGVKVVVDPKSALYVTGSELDFVDALTDGGFKVKNPNAATSCSCGESFSA